MLKDIVYIVCRAGSSPTVFIPLGDLNLNTLLKEEQGVAVTLEPFGNEWDTF